MSYLLGLLEELQSFLEILLLFTIVLRKGAKVISGTNGIKKEIKIVLNVFVIKQKIEELKEIGIMHSKTNMNDIPKLM